MSKPLQEKLKVLRYFLDSEGVCIDVGCANGDITKSMAELLPEWNFLGIDLNSEFISRANEGIKPNTEFENIYLRAPCSRK